MFARTMLLVATTAATFALGACAAATSTGGVGGFGGAGGAGVSGTAGGTGGTAGGCAALCPQLNKCPEITPSDCAAECPAIDKFNTDSLCKTKYDAEVACILADTDPCSAPTFDCITEVDDYVVCHSDYCDAHPSDPGCM
jgi:hypothetical protein